MTDLQRIKKIINWLIFIGYADNERLLAEQLGYSKSSFSQIVNGRIPLSDNFIQKITSLDKNINKVWLKTGEGRMLKQNVYLDSIGSIQTVIANDYASSHRIDDQESQDFHEDRGRYQHTEAILNEKDKRIALLEKNTALLEKQIALLEKHIAFLENDSIRQNNTEALFTGKASAKNAAFSKGKTAKGNVRSTTLG